MDGRSTSGVGSVWVEGAEVNGRCLRMDEEGMLRLEVTAVEEAEVPVAEPSSGADAETDWLLSV